LRQPVEPCGKLVGYYLPTTIAGPTNTAFGLIDFPNLADYEQCREKLGSDPDAMACLRRVEAAGCMRAQLAGQLAYEAGLVQEEHFKDLGDALDRPALCRDRLGRRQIWRGRRTQLIGNGPVQHHRAALSLAIPSAARDTTASSWSFGRAPTTWRTDSGEPPAVTAGRPSSVAKHVTVRASGTQFSAQFRTVRPSLSAGPDPRGTHLTYDVTYNDVRLTASEDRRVLQLQLTIASKRFGLGRAADHFHAPRLYRFTFRGRCR
jgi:hypothetical protein